MATRGQLYKDILCGAIEGGYACWLAYDHAVRDASTVDAEGADVVIQAGLFNEIVFG